MAGKKNASKASSKMATSDGQRSLFHFYQKKTKPENDTAKTTEVVKEETVPLPSDASEPPTLLPTDGMATSSSRSLETETTQRQPLIESAVDDTTSPQESESHAPQIAIHSDTTPGKSTVDVLDDDTPREIPQPHSRSGSVSLPQQPNVVDGLNSSSEIQGVYASDRPPPREPFPIFKHRLPPPSSPLLGKRSSNQPASSSKLSPPESQWKPEVFHHSGLNIGLNDVVDLTNSPPHDRSEKSVLAKFTGYNDSIIVIDDEPEPRGSQGAPIELSSSPPPKSKIQQNKTTHPFFARRSVKRKEGNNITTPSTTISTTLHIQFPWPDAETQHVRGPQSCFWPSSSQPFPRYRGSLEPTWFSSQPSIRFLENHTVTRPLFPESRPCALRSHASTSLDREKIISRIPSSHREHSGISRLLDVEVQSGRTAENGEAWTHKWRPRSAAEVLGNEENVRYMKEWLEALEIRTSKPSGETLDAKGKSTAPIGARGTKRLTVVRAVEKKRGRKRRRVESDDGSSLGDWIVEEEEEEEEPVSEVPSDNELLFPRSSPLDQRVPVSPASARPVDGAEDVKPPDRHDAHRPTEFTQLTNTIILTGPPGSGKTSAVYACAEELGWEVFEVYPGIGRRSGANISSLVGDVGKNHIVGRRGASGSSAKSSVPHPFMRSGFGYLAEDHKAATSSDDGNRAVRQSIILLEEVDILFKEDANFWPAVVNIIKSSHRPVFMTCNDISLVPRDDLPLQATLLFQPCPAPLAISFLQSVCLVEGQVVSREQLDAMYSTTYELASPDQPDEPQIPYPSQPQAGPDLRRVLNELQFWCQRESCTGDDVEPEAATGTSLITASSSAELLADWSRSPGMLAGCSPEEMASQGSGIFLMWKHSEYASYVDGYLERRPSDVLEALAIDRYGPSVDDEIGHTLLEKSKAFDHSNGLSFYNQDEVIAQEALAMSRHVLESTRAGPRARTSLLGDERGATLESRSLLRGRAANQTLVVSYLDDLIPLSAPLLPRSAAVLEYAAYVRQMVAADDSQKERTGSAEDGGRSTRGRETRRGWRGGEERYLMLSPAGLEGARTTGWARRR